jgi:hypothetical protein
MYAVRIFLHHARYTRYRNACLSFGKPRDHVQGKPVGNRSGLFTIRTYRIDKANMCRNGIALGGIPLGGTPLGGTPLGD